MPEIILDQAQIVSFVGKRKSAGMSQHMGIDVPQFRLLSGPRNPCRNIRRSKI